MAPNSAWTTSGFHVSQSVSTIAAKDGLQRLAAQSGCPDRTRGSMRGSRESGRTDEPLVPGRGDSIIRSQQSASEGSAGDSSVARRYASATRCRRARLLTSRAMAVPPPCAGSPPGGNGAMTSTRLLATATRDRQVSSSRRCRTPVSVLPRDERRVPTTRPRCHDAAPFVCRRGT